MGWKNLFAWGMSGLPLGEFQDETAKELHR